MMDNSVNPCSRIVSNQSNLGNSNQNPFPFRIKAGNASSSTPLTLPPPQNDQNLPPQDLSPQNVQNYPSYPNYQNYQNY